MTDDDGFRLEAADQYGFEDVAEGTCLSQDGYFATELEVIAFAKACERNGRASAVQFLRRELNNPLNEKASIRTILICVIGALSRVNCEIDIELRELRARQGESVA